jgi:hypothetical protein
MSVSTVQHIATRAGYSVVVSKTIAWGGLADLDGIALLHKPLQQQQ